MADANSAYSLDKPAHLAALRALDDLNLMMIEQPLADDDIVDHARLQAQLRTPICLDESIHSVHDARKALDLGSCRIINIKVSRLGGLSEARRVHDLCAARDVPVWCGGMHEFGVGRAANVAICSLPGFTLPGDVSGSDRAYRQDIVEPPIHAHAGAIDVPWDSPGLGFAADLERIKRNTQRELVLEAETAAAPV
jgi:O-succinylbenzoate synthase